MKLIIMESISKHLRQRKQGKRMKQNRKISLIMEIYRVRSSMVKF